MLPKSILTVMSLLALSKSTTSQQFRLTNSNATVSTSSSINFQTYPYSYSTKDDRPDTCPPCFNCNLAQFPCQQYALCSNSTGQCTCPFGFGGQDCGAPLCGSLAHPNAERPVRDISSTQCDCEEGWEGLNCNVCKTNAACDALMPEKEGGRCYTGETGVVKQNYQMCDITNKKILDQLKEDKPQTTFSCDAEDKTCGFQFWIGGMESFYCALDTCSWSAELEESRNTTKYHCENIKCRCIPGRNLCGKDGMVDIGDFLDEELRGPASFVTVTEHGQPSRSTFEEPAMNELIGDVFGDRAIFLSCRSGECLYKTDVPGYERPIKKINTPLISGIIAGCGLFVVAVIVLVYFLSRRNNSRYGPIHLSDEDEGDAAKLMTDHKPAALLFEDISYSLKGKQILHEISGSVHPGELLAIIGSSGAGKSTALDILARKNKRGRVTGNVYVNGHIMSDSDYKGIIGFVDQDDTLLPTLTVHETIMDSAMLRLPKDMSHAVKEQKVEDVERQLGIYHIKDQIIGSEEGQGRGISGGEKRRVGIACELVTSPSILIMDEPTTGLDAYNAYNVIECLANLVKTFNRTVIVTIHQPRSNIVSLFDRLLLLAQGRTVYSGPFDACQRYFDGIGYTCPPGFNIADYLIDLTMHASQSGFADVDHSNMINGHGHEGRATRASSAVGIKSVASLLSSVVSIDQSPTSPPRTTSRPISSHKPSLRQLQERQLFTRRKTGQDDTSITHTTAPSSITEPDAEGQRLNTLKKSVSRPSVNSRVNNGPSSTGTSLDILIQSYHDSVIYNQLMDDIQSAKSSSLIEDSAISPNTNQFHQAAPRPSLARQFLILSTRTWRNIYRNPLLMLTHYAISILLAVLIGWLFYGLTDDLPGFQNRLGFFFFLLALFGFSSLSSLTVFAPERLLFVRERAKGYYSPLAYYTAKVVFDIVPLRLIPPILMGAIVYPMTGLRPAWLEFSRFMLFVVMFNLAAATVCLSIGILIKNQGVASLVGVLFMLFSLLFGGFLLNHDTIPKAVTWLQSLSIFHYAFEGLIVNEVYPLTLVDKKYGLNIEVPGSAILSSFGFDNLALNADAIGLGVYCVVFLCLGYAAMHFVLVERR